METQVQSALTDICKTVNLLEDRVMSLRNHLDFGLTGIKGFRGIPYTEGGIPYTKRVIAAISEQLDECEKYMSVFGGQDHLKKKSQEPWDPDVEWGIDPENKEMEKIGIKREVAFSTKQDYIKWLKRELDRFNTPQEGEIAEAQGYGRCPDCVWFNQLEDCNVKRDSSACLSNKQFRT
jgi:hypothetical protein